MECVCNCGAAVTRMLSFGVRANRHRRMRRHMMKTTKMPRITGGTIIPTTIQCTLNDYT